MAALSAVMYTHTFQTRASSNRATPSPLSSMSSQPARQQTLQQQQQPPHQQPHQPHQQDQQPDQDQNFFDDQQYTTLFCRALYDYEAQDASALSFRRGDIIEVLTKQPSGWWDGLLGDERGWFPSNYVTLISDEEAEAAFATQEPPASDTVQVDQQTDSFVDISHAMTRGSQSENEEWLDNELSYRNGLGSLANAAASTSNASQPSDFWMPEVTPNGQIYYVNTHTGQRSRDLPQEAEEDVSDSDLAGLTTQSTSRSGSAARLPFGLGQIDPLDNTQDAPGFGVPRSTGTPEPWVRRLADDGMSYYYFNKLDERMQWPRPEAPERPPAAAASSSRPYPVIPIASTESSADKSRLSVYSDDSDVAPLDHLRPKARLEPQQNGSSRRIGESPPPPVAKTMPRHNAMLELTTAERLAKSLQQALSPAPAEFVTDLSAVVKGSIQSAVDNIQNMGQVRRGDEDQRMDMLVSSVVQAVRNLVYISAPPTGQIPLMPSQGRDAKADALKHIHRKVTSTLSRFVLSARTIQYDSGSQFAETLSRAVADAFELEKAVFSFVSAVQRSQNTGPNASPDAKPSKRLEGVFSTANIGLGLVGAGAAGSWKGFGWVSLDDEHETPQRILNSTGIAEIGSHLMKLDEGLRLLSQTLRLPGENFGDQILRCSQDVVTQLTTFLTLVSDIHVARHVDIDGIGQGGAPTNERYLQTVENARRHVRRLETIIQAIYDDSAALFVAAQKVPDAESQHSASEQAAIYDLIDSLSSLCVANLGLVKPSLEALLAIGHEQADMAQDDYNGSIEHRMSRLSVISNRFGGSLRPNSSNLYDLDDDIVDDAFVFAPGAMTRPVQKTSNDPFPLTNGTSSASETPSHHSKDSIDKTVSSHTVVGADSIAPDNDDITIFDDDLSTAKSKSQPRPGGSNAAKLQKLLGEEYADKVAADHRPWFLRPDYTDLQVDPDGSVRGGTVPALVERLTAHEQADPTFTRAFLMTYKSFTTLNELFDLLVERFKIQPPANLSNQELEEWKKLKQHVIRMRVINTFKSMIVDEDVLEKEDMYILERMKQFISSEEVSRFAAAKQLQILIERAQRGGEAGIKTLVNTNLGPPPPPILPRTAKKLKLLDIEPLEMARQLTIMESQLYQKIRPMECLQRSREQKTDSMDNITAVIQTSNRIAQWVAESILSKDDSRRRAQVVKHLIIIADRCRTLNNFSTMIAITSGLNTPPIRRLKRTWEQVSQRYMAQFGACEMTIDSNKNFTKYRQLMASVTPPCVPFIGVFLSTLQFIQDGNPDNLPGGMVNFRKRQKASEVINDIKRWQAQPFNLQPVPSIQAYIEESLGKFKDVDTSDAFWKLSLELEPREREDEKMARLLQESGFL
ncbi:ras guanine nucleotide exchange factor domain-containing protein [Cyathus striatus]|nr:ras guanine nucleotide exchange factor domain-containing protein [Cyathus striatus]